MKKLFLYIIFFFIAFACKEKFNTDLHSPSTGYLVVEGFIGSGNDPTAISLSRSVKLVDSVNIIYETNASVTVEGENNETFPLNENINGSYTSAGSLNLNANEKYRIHIITRNNKEYISDFESVKHTPPIDSITFQRENGGLRIFIDTHDAQNNTRYYKWNYEETWEIRSSFLSNLKYIRDPATNMIEKVDYRYPLTQAPDTTIYRCWVSNSSKSTNIGSSEKLTADVIHQPLNYIEHAAEKLSVLYSIKIKQYALSHEAYLFFEKIKKNTEQLGSIFDAQPSELKGNIHCVSDPKEPVIGFIGVSEEMNMRIFIRNNEVPGWGYNPFCSEIIIDNNADSIMKYGLSLTPTTPSKTMNLQIIQFGAASPSCVDCTLKGTNVRPSFWP
ncbi:MAG: DUF4249 domain-containing protein [Ginsengibacter sp.]